MERTVEVGRRALRQLPKIHSGRGSGLGLLHRLDTELDRHTRGNPRLAEFPASI